MRGPSTTLSGRHGGRVVVLLPWLLAAGVLLVGGLVLLGVDRMVTRLHTAELRRSVEQRAAPYANGMVIAVGRRVALLNGLRAFVQLNLPSAGFDDRFADFAGELYASTAGIRTMQFVRNGVITNTYPLLGNEEAVGLDVRQHPVPQVRADLRAAEAGSGAILSGPLELQQGGRGLITRLGARDDRGRVLGVVAVVSDFEQVLAESGVLEAPALSLALLDERGVLVHGDSSITDAVRIPIQLENRAWTLLAAPHGGWSAGGNGARDAFRLTGVSILLLVTLIAHLLGGRQESLRRAVAERTESLTRANRALADQMSQRERAEAQLLASQKLEGLGRLAGGVAHDFNNLLTGILGYVSILQEGADPGSETRADLDQIERAARRAAELTRQLLTFARQQEVMPRVLDPNEVVSESVRLLRRMISEDIDLRLELEPTAWPVRIDPTQLDQVVTNLVINARDAVPQGGTVSVQTANEVLDPSWLGLPAEATTAEFVRLDVTDTGVGMDEEIIGRIFEPFFTTKEQGKGTGLGLAICYGIVKQAGGSIGVTSTPGEGTTVTIHLPRAAGPVDSPAAVEHAPADWRGSGTILLVEDEEFVRDLARRTLEARGFTVLTAAHGEEALDVAAAHDGRVDLLLTDVVMPRLGGRAMAERLRARQGQLRIIFMSGHSNDPRVADVVADRAASFLPKPFTPRALEQAVRAALA